MTTYDRIIEIFPEATSEQREAVRPVADELETALSDGKDLGVPSLTMETRVGRLEGAYEYLATKTDVAELKTELKTDIVGVKIEIASVKTDLRTEIAELKSSLIKWMVGVQLATITTVALIVGSVVAVLSL